jgi:hypothetical protein
MIASSIMSATVAAATTLTKAFTTSLEPALRASRTRHGKSSLQMVVDSAVGPQAAL